MVNDPFIQLLNKGRGAGLRLTIATQTFAAFAARTGSEAKARQVLGNINNLIALRVLDAETQQCASPVVHAYALRGLAVVLLLNAFVLLLPVPLPALGVPMAECSLRCCLLSPSRMRRSGCI